MPIRPALTSTELQERVHRANIFRAGYDALPHQVVITDPDGHIVFINKTAQQVTGYREEELLGKNPGDFWGGRMPKEFYEKMWHRIKVEKKPFTGQVTNMRKDGTEVHQELMITPVLDADGNIEFFIALEPEIEDPEKRRAFQEEISSVLGHQARSPITSINWTLEYLMEEGGLNEEQTKMLKAAYQKSKDLAELVSDVLVAGQLGSRSLNSEELDLRELIQLALTEQQVAYPSHQVIYQPPAEPVTVRTSPSLARQVFANLIHNAFKYAAEDGGRVIVRLTTTDDGFRFEIENDGLVIPADEHDSVFTKAYRSKAARERGEGTGIGLFVSKLICDDFGWRISFESPSSDLGGTLFTLEG